MLSGIHPILAGDLLAALDRLGHGDEIAVVDANFPAHRVAATGGPSTGASLVELPGLEAPAVVRAIRTVIPLDEYEAESALLMAGEGGERLPVQHELVDAADAPEHRVGELERFAFYARAEGAGLVVRTGETRVYANLIIRKGVIHAPDSWEAAR
ncbi:transport protein RbsD/FucU [Agromyces sp. CFH 90414]|uniref:Transport protein RbsD/FucU n=1 Tax=Agromyces agglutinans TaxID=2662258 RepID=A0A6I2FFA5_9MICO|nr:RbsD/FucU domain-containing protein [Agromyces agglutinans]MRG61400.1 transport protein RbsD/FucU [Agromyces agglutinans]